MIRKALFFLIALIVFTAFKSDKPAYILFNQKGKAVKYKRMLETAQKADVVFFGELHNNPISHWLQYELTQDLHDALNGQIILGAEMFEADNQIALSEYLNDVINKDSLKKSARLWPNYKTDIEPLVEFARENKLSFVATNIPRRYASMVFRHGFESLDTLSIETKEFIAPLPVAYDPELPGYKKMLTMMGESVHGRSPENFPKAQAIK
ncbi:MAG: ChaN family lipoprotein, partial [Bacteroidales bacterium]|nr:ChaN family lipoprotein [Bacteroidales bacterium]